MAGFVGAFATGFKTFGYHTEAANTAIDEEVGGQNGKRLALISMEYLAAATAHDVSVMYAEDNAVSGAVGSSRNTTNGATLSGQKDIICTVAPESPAGAAAAASDIIAFQLTDGTWEWDTVASLAGSTITCTNNVTGVDAAAGGTAMADNAKIMILGVVGDLANFKVHCLASVVTSFDNTPRIIHPYIGEPFFLSSDNGTNAGFLNSAVFAYLGNK